MQTGNAYVTGATSSNTKFPGNCSAFQTTSGVMTVVAVVMLSGVTTRVCDEVQPRRQWPLSTPRVSAGSRPDIRRGNSCGRQRSSLPLGITSSTTTFSTAKRIRVSVHTCCATDLFISKFNSAGSALIYSTYYGSETEEIWADIGC
jgi:hypothetical protein